MYSNADASRVIVWRLLNILKAHLCMYISEHIFTITHFQLFFFYPNLCLCLYFPRLSTTANRTSLISVLPFFPNPVHPCTLRWRHNEHDGVSNHQPHDCLLSRLFRRRSKKTSKLRVTGLCVGNSPVSGEFPHKWPVTRKMFPFDDVIMISVWALDVLYAFIDDVPKRQILHKPKLHKSLHASMFPSIIVKDSPVFPLTC